METALSLQTKVLTKAEMPVSAQIIADGLLEQHSGIESFVIVKNMISTLEQSLEIMRERAIATANGKEEIVLGAKVTVKNLPKKWEYSGTEYTRLANNLENSKAELKSHQKILELSKDGWVNPATGETETATEIPQEKTRTLTVTF